jgi:hypothetical protein
MEVMIDSARRGESAARPMSRANTALLVEGPEAMIRPVGTRRLVAGDFR